MVAAALQRVLALERAPAAGDRLDHDLHADSLDLVETIEVVQADLAARGLAATVDPEALARLATVSDAIGAVLAGLHPRDPAI